MVIGSAMDELIRHHPNLKTPVFNALAATLVKIEELGATYVDPNGLPSPYKLQLVPRALEPSDAPELPQHTAMDLGQPRPPTPIPMQTDADEVADTMDAIAQLELDLPESVLKGVDLHENLVVLYVDVTERVSQGEGGHG
jgi:E3 ubiquitin-protein ligase HUWE1